MTQHLEDGTLHAYIDGELPRAEAEALEAHVAECVSCGAALAEARGLVAAASRAITALDAAPSSARKPAVPVAGSASEPTRRAARPPIFRVPYARVAALLLLVGGTAVVLDRSGTFDREDASRDASLLADPARESEPVATPAPEAATMAAPENTQQLSGERDRSTPIATASRPPARRTTPAPRVVVGVATDAATGERRAEPTITPTAPAPLVEGQGVSFAASARRQATSIDSARPPVVAAAPPPPPARPVEMRLSEVVVTGAPSTIARVTRYRTQEGTILTLTEEPLRTSFAEETTAARRIPSQRVQQNAVAAMSVPAVNSYRWSSAERGLAYTLTGPLTVAELGALSKRLSELERLP